MENGNQNGCGLQAGTQFIVLSADDLRSVVSDAVQQTLQSMQRATQDELITPTQAGRLLSVAKSTLWRWAKTGYLSPVKIGAKTMYHAADIERIKGKM